MTRRDARNNLAPHPRACRCSDRCAIRKVVLKRRLKSGIPSLENISRRPRYRERRADVDGEQSPGSFVLNERGEDLFILNASGNLGQCCISPLYRPCARCGPRERFPRIIGTKSPKPVQFSERVSGFAETGRPLGSASGE